MTDRWRAFLSGMGSILDIWPDPAEMQALLPQGTAEERLRRHWERVGEHFSAAMGSVAEDASKEDAQVAAPEGKNAEPA